MQINFTSEINNNYDITILGIYDKNKLSNTASKFDKSDIISKSIKNSNFSAKCGEIMYIFSEKIMLVGLGSEEKLTATTLQKLGGLIGASLQKQKIKNAFLMLDNFSDTKNFNIAYGATLKTYTFDKYKTKSETTNTTLSIYSQNPKKSETDFIDTKSIINGIITTRNLANEPSNILTTTQMIAEVKKLAKLGIKIEIFDKTALKKMGANLILAVGSGSSHPPYMAVMKYTGNKKSKNKIALIGKGLCFDSGGICLKPSKGMDEMKSDMTGASTVIGIMQSLAERKAKANVIGVIGLAENMPDGASYKPGDILTSLSGKTVEVIDTDAEGRLVLADCLTYTAKKIKPDLMIDFATLTGAIIVALGEDITGLFSNSQKLSTDLLNSGKATGEELWSLPMDEKFQEMIKSNIADIANLGHPSRTAGSITAAKFLENFTEDINWAHLDIAGTAWTTNGNDISPKGLTGVGVNLINHFISTHYENK